MAGRGTDGSVALESPHMEPEPLHEPSEETFDWVDHECPCPNCGAPVTDFRTKDLCNMLDTVDFRIVHHFYAECKCGTWIDFIRKTADGIEDFDRRTEQF
jgi:hypothetical protein